MSPKPDPCTCGKPALPGRSQGKLEGRSSPSAQLAEPSVLLWKCWVPLQQVVQGVLLVQLAQNRVLGRAWDGQRGLGLVSVCCRTELQCCW